MIGFLETFWPSVLAASLVGASAPTIGAFIVQKRLSLLGDGVGHMAFAGVALGLWLGIAPLAGALGAATLGAIGLDRLRRRSQEESDLLLAMFFYGSIALAVVVASRTGSFNVRLFGFLFGQILTVTSAELITISVLGAVVGLVVISFYRGLVATAIDEESAAVAGVPVDWLNAILMLLAAVTIGVGMQVVGILLVASIMVIPVGIARNLVQGFRNVVAVASLVGAAGSLCGLLAANSLNSAPGGTIVLVLIGFYICSGIAAMSRSRRLRHAEPVA